MASWVPWRSVPMESALVGCLFVALPCGTAYGFSLYSQAMQEQAGLTSGELLNIITLPQLFGLLSPLAGWFTTAYGLRPALWIGWVLGVLGLIMQYLVCVQAVDLGPPALSLLLFASLQFIGQIFCTVVAFPVPVQHYQHKRGQAIALVKAFVGMAGTCVAQIFWISMARRPGFQKTGPDALMGLLLWAGMATLGCFIGMLLIPSSADPDPAKESGPRLQTLFYFLLAWGICSIVVGVQQDATAHLVLAATLMVMLGCLPIILLHWSRQGPRLGPPVSEARFETSNQKTCTEMLCTADCWCFFMGVTAVLAGGVVISNSISDILTAAGMDSNDALVLAETLWSSGNMIGRLTCMLPSDALVRRGWPRPVVVFALLLCMSFSHVLLLFLPSCGSSPGGQQAVVAVACFLGGYSFGAAWPHMVVITSELFGTRHLASNYMFYDGSCNAVASLLVGRVLVGMVQNAHTEPGALHCVGAGCFRLSHIVMLASCGVGAFATAILVHRSAKEYRNIQRALATASNDGDKAAAHLVQ